MPEPASYADEARMYWCEASEFHALLRGDAPDSEVEKALDAIEVVSDYTDYPMVRDRCLAILNRETLASEAV